MSLIECMYLSSPRATYRHTKKLQPLHLMQPPNVRARRRVPHHAKLYYKVVAARDDGSFRSIYDGTTNYAVGEVTTGPPLYACHSIGAVVVHGRHRLSDECAMLDAPRAILRCWGWRLDGSLPAPVGTPGKYRLDALLPIAALPWSSTGGHDGIPPYSELRPPARGVASAVVCGPAALRRGGARWEQRRCGTQASREST